MCFLLRRYEHAYHEASAQRNVKFTGTFTLRISPKTTSCRRIVKYVGMDSRALVGKTLPLLLWCSFIYKINYRLFSSFVRNEFFFNDGSFLSRDRICHSKSCSHDLLWINLQTGFRFTKRRSFGLISSCPENEVGSCVTSVSVRRLRIPVAI